MRAHPAVVLEERVMPAMSALWHPRDAKALLRWAFVAAALVWALALPFAPIAATTPAVGWPSRAAAALAYAIGALVCHQQPVRSFAIAGVPLPVCARCTGIYAGAAVAVVWFVLGRVHRRGSALDLASARTALLACALPIALTVGFEWATGATPSNLVRALSGAPLGASVAWVMLRA